MFCSNDQWADASVFCIYCGFCDAVNWLDIIRYFDCWKWSVFCCLGRFKIMAEVLKLLQKKLYRVFFWNNCRELLDCRDYSSYSMLIQNLITLNLCFLEHKSSRTMGFIFRNSFSSLILIYANLGGCRLMFSRAEADWSQRLWSQGPLQSPIQNVKRGLLDFFVWNVAEAFWSQSDYVLDTLVLGFSGHFTLSASFF
jgi:hypothetical protein